MRFASIRRVAVVTLTAGALFGTSGCFGSFNLVRKVYSFNKSASDNKFVREALFLGLNIIPVYGVASFIDALIVNTVEFWSGKNPVDMSSTIKVDSTTTVKKVAVEKNGVRTMTLTAYTFDKLVATTTVQYVPGADHMTFVTVLGDGRKETHVAVMGTDGKAFVSSGTYADLQRTGFKAGE